MAKSRGKDWLISADGFRARNNGLWAKEKLSFLDEFVPPRFRRLARENTQSGSAGT